MPDSFGRSADADDLDLSSELVSVPGGTAERQIMKMKRVLKYPGSKWNIAKDIVALIPEHKSYLEPFFGSGAVLFTKPPSKIETINDIDGDVVNLFECIRKDPERLARDVAATPYAREEYDFAHGVTHVNSYERFERARLFLVKMWQGYGYRSNESKVGWKNDVQGRERAYALAEWYRLPGAIMEAAERLRMVQIEHKPALDLIEKFDFPNVFMYVDPPYVLSTRSQKQYAHEMYDEDHEVLLKALLRSSAKIMISGYESKLYNDYLHNWEKRQFSSCAEGGLPRTEIIWMNYHTEKQMSLFD